jgi:hypothetical protein
VDRERKTARRHRKLRPEEKGRKHLKPWTPKEIRLIADEYVRGKTAEQILKDNPGLGRNLDSVESWRHKLASNYDGVEGKRVVPPSYRLSGGEKGPKPRSTLDPHREISMADKLWYKVMHEGHKPSEGKKFFEDGTEIRYTPRREYIKLVMNLDPKRMDELEKWYAVTYPSRAGIRPPGLFGFTPPTLKDPRGAKIVKRYRKGRRGNANMVGL